MQNNSSAVPSPMVHVLTDDSSTVINCTVPFTEFTLAFAVYLLIDFLLGILSVVINTLILLVLYKESHLQTIGNCFLCSLAASDVCKSFFAIPVVVITHSVSFTNPRICLILHYVPHIFINISILCLLVVALDRFFAINIPFQYRRLMTTDLASIMVAVTWIFGFIAGLLPAVQWDLEKIQFHMCKFHLAADPMIVTYGTFVIFCPSLITVCIVYTYIFFVVRRTKAVLRTLIVDPLHRTGKLGKARQPKRLFLIPVTTILCRTPFQVIHIIVLYSDESYISENIVYIGVLLDHLESVLNPFLYAFDNTQIRVAAVKILFNNFQAYTQPDIDTRQRRSRFHPVPPPVEKKRKKSVASSEFSNTTLESMHDLSIGEELLANPLAQNVFSNLSLAKHNITNESRLTGIKTHHMNLSVSSLPMLETLKKRFRSRRGKTDKEESVDMEKIKQLIRDGTDWNIVNDIVEKQTGNNKGGRGYSSVSHSVSVTSTSEANKAGRRYSYWKNKSFP